MTIGSRSGAMEAVRGCGSRRPQVLRFDPMDPGYVREEFSAEERALLSRHFTNLDGPVFALVNLPEVVKGALFARYSRSPKSLRRLFLDEFMGDRLEAGGGARPAGAARARQLHGRLVSQYGDDSGAPAGGVPRA